MWGRTGHHGGLQQRTWTCGLAVTHLLWTPLSVLLSLPCLVPQAAAVGPLAQALKRPCSPQAAAVGALVQALPWLSRPPPQAQLVALVHAVLVILKRRPGS